MIRRQAGGGRVDGGVAPSCLAFLLDKSCWTDKSIRVSAEHISHVLAYATLKLIHIAVTNCPARRAGLSDRTHYHNVLASALVRLLPFAKPKERSYKRDASPSGHAPIPCESPTWIYPSPPNILAEKGRSRARPQLLRPLQPPPLLPAAQSLAAPIRFGCLHVGSGAAVALAEEGEGRGRALLSRAEGVLKADMRGGGEDGRGAIPFGS